MILSTVLLREEYRFQTKQQESNSVTFSVKLPEDNVIIPPKEDNAEADPSLSDG